MTNVSQFWHILFIIFRNDVSMGEKDRIIKLHKELGENCGGAKAGITMWRVEKNLDMRKGVHAIQMSIFKNKEAFEMFRQHPAHKEFAESLSKVADWTVGDFLID